MENTAPWNHETDHGAGFLEMPSRLRERLVAPCFRRDEPVAERAGFGGAGRPDLRQVHARLQLREVSIDRQEVRFSGAGAALARNATESRPSTARWFSLLFESGVPKGQRTMSI